MGNDQLLRDRVKNWAQGKDDQLKLIENQGEIGLWDRLGYGLGDTARELMIDFTSGKDGVEDYRKDLLTEAENRAKDVYQARQQAQPTPTPIPLWDRMVNSGK